ncbi:MAG: FecR domain-containing protein [Bacteroidales bacterium]
MIQNDILKKYLEGKASDEEKEKVMLWIEASPEHAREFMKLRRLYDIELFLKPEYSSTNIQAKSSNNILTNNKKKNNFTLLRISKRIAASIILVFVCTYLLSIYNPFDTQNAEIQTLIVPAGQRAKLVLSDSSVIWLNANSKLTYSSNFNSKTRDVTLIGEGYFDVKHNAKKPFIVHTKNYSIKDLGTEFNVKAYDSNYFEASLLEGSILLYNKEKTLCHLVPNERVFTKDGKIYKDIIQDKCHFKWIDGIIAIDNRSVSDLLSELELIFDTKVINNNPKLKDIRYTGKFRTADGIEHVLKVLQLNCEFTYKIMDNGNKIIIY